MRRSFTIRLFPVLAFLLGVGLPLAALADSFGALVIEGFSDQRLLFLNHHSGDTADLGALAPTAVRVHVADHDAHGRLVMVLNGDSWMTGDGGGIWIADAGDVSTALLGDGEVPWTMHSFGGGLNPYHLATAVIDDQLHLFVSLQAGNAVRDYLVDPETHSLDLQHEFPAAMPQGLAFTEGVLAVAEADLGAGNTVLLYEPETAALDTVTVGLNPQEIAAQDGLFWVLCTGNYADVEGEAWRLDNGAGTGVVTLGGSPTSIAVQDPAPGPGGQPWLLTGDDFAASPPTLTFFHGLTLDEGTVPADATGGWALAAGRGHDEGSGGEVNGYYVGSSVENRVQFRRVEDLTVHGASFQLSGPAAALAAFSAGFASADEPDPALPSRFTLAPVYPNPFNAAARSTLTLDRPASVRVLLVNGLGRQVRTLASGRMAAGQNGIAVDAAGLASGRYYLAVTAGGRRLVQPLTLVR